MSSVEVEKRKRVEQDDGKARGDRADLKRAPPPPTLPPDEEVEEFFAIVKRIRVALKYFKRRDGGVDGAVVPAEKLTWSPSFERQDFDGVKTETECSHGRGETGLDLNADPVSSDSV